MTPKEIEQKANEILLTRETRRSHMQTCLQAGLCPKCGEPVSFQDEDGGVHFCTYARCPSGHMYASFDDEGWSVSTVWPAPKRSLLDRLFG